ncbi:hypothetical protein BAUCODRAFT_228804 [Baudoinia panamericana UAMH 10762]|uniref:DNA2/NAM7 helicase helicase domain-containing protein n=1 Tax=Baudoinia panamericana (strain UAMH 10762) TaxID=717646 RepID=M2N351_BAUPA|nr:uncharacterized protein BAUCODRAFT_228804 [Baudoinia panamericana UAMH 10762]EMC93115.1 hypothetical protein BAUCODRAFT_228804 [Baudoinia panamericana UAMH 10762]
MGGVRYRLSVKLRGDLPNSGGQKIIPYNGTDISARIAGLDLDSTADDSFRGRGSGTTLHGYDFSIDTELPGVLQGHPNFEIVDREIRSIHVFWCGHNEDFARKITSTSHTGVEVKLRLPRKPLIIDDSGIPRGKFCLRNIIADEEGAYLSCDFRAQYLTAHPDDEQFLAQVDSILETFSLNNCQRRFVDAAMSGVRAATVLLEGYPGSGKSHALACLIAGLIMMNQRVIIGSQSNHGADALFEQLVGKLNSIAPSSLARRCIRLRNERDGERLANDFFDGLPNTPDLFPSSDYSMSANIADG